MINFQSVMKFTNDPQLKTLKSGKELVNFSLAEKSGKGTYERMLWLDCVMFGDRCQSLIEWFKKGDYIQVAGELNTQSWEDKDTGKKRYKNELRVVDYSFVGGKSDNQPAPQQTQQTLPNSTPAADEAPF